MASRSDPAPALLMVVTVKTAGASRSSDDSTERRLWGRVRVIEFFTKPMVSPVEMGPAASRRIGKSTPRSGSVRTERLALERPNVDNRAAVAVAVLVAREAGTALVRGRHICVVAMVDRRTAGQQGVRRSPAAVVPERPDLRVDRAGARSHDVAVDAIGEGGDAVADADQVVPLARECSGRVRATATEEDQIQGNECVLDSDHCGAVFEDTTTGPSTVFGDGAIQQTRPVGANATSVTPGGIAADSAVGQCGLVGEKAAAVTSGGIAAESAIGQRRREPIEDATTVAAGGIAADSAVGQRRRAVGEEAATVSGGVVVAEGAVDQCRRRGKDAATVAVGGVVAVESAVGQCHSAGVDAAADDTEVAADGAIGQCHSAGVQAAVGVYSAPGADAAADTAAAAPGGVAGDGAVGQRRRAAGEEAAAVLRGVTADCAIGQYRREGGDSAAIAGSGVAAEGAVGQRRRFGGDTTAVIPGRVSSEVAVGQRRRKCDGASAVAASHIPPNRAVPNREYVVRRGRADRREDATALLARNVEGDCGADQCDIARPGLGTVGDAAAS